MVPRLTEIQLSKKYKFMYENFILASQHELYLLLELHETLIYGLRFYGLLISKYGYPNDEVLGSHYLSKLGLKWYTFYEVQNSPWIMEINNSNNIHPKNTGNIFLNEKHFIINFKDVTFECISKSYKEIVIKIEDLQDIMKKEIELLE